MGLRFIIFLAAIWIVLLIIRFYLGRAPKKKQHSQRGTNIDTVRCQQCGLVIPEEEAIQQDNQYFCSKEHAND